ncbi:hypothetical protein FN846DRAFT_893412 [Sphaerosporella brunnea]|uniref:Uncharacterized protein n=1 Tax=Sphaerosporella brunnea TaxID=1250544 RepID=A0A5J5ELZ5_9PEZI|nr:hypothetical protein FN846DRAFT_893412 [Sphaerosporella brunnea]
MPGSAMTGHPPHGQIASLDRAGHSAAPAVPIAWEYGNDRRRSQFALHGRPRRPRVVEPTGETEVVAVHRCAARINALEVSHNDDDEVAALSIGHPRQHLPAEEPFLPDGFNRRHPLPH